MDKKSRIYIAGHMGMVGSAIKRKLVAEGYINLIYRTSQELDLTDSKEVELFFKENHIEYVFLSAAKVGGIGANNNYPADFIYTNLQIQNNVIHYSYINNVKKLLFLGSSCIYPKLALQPMKEEYLLTSALEKTNAPYAIAKIAGIHMCQSYNRQHNTNFIACMPTNLYGPNDNYDLETSHVIPALIRKIHEAKINNTSVTLWGDGSAMREFLYVDDMANACIYMMKEFNPSTEQNEAGDLFMNIGTGKDITIADLAESTKKIVGFEGEILWDISKPNGTPRKLLDVSKLSKLGWEYSVDLEEGIQKSYNWFLKNSV